MATCMQPRLFRFARLDNGPLAYNHRHATAARFALKLYRQNAIYTFIPKNGCSNMRLTLAIENGCIAGEQDYLWVHDNNETFRASLQDLVTAEYTFVILRDPFLRLASMFLDKFVAKDPIAWAFQRMVKREADLDDMTFTQFVHALACAPALLAANDHWRPQSEFLIYERYDDYFALERLDAASAALKARLGIDVRDGRHLFRHGLDQAEIVEDGRNYASMPIHRLAKLKRLGKVPRPRTLFTPATVREMETLYGDDLALYREKIGLPLLFESGPAAG